MRRGGVMSKYDPSEKEVHEGQRGGVIETNSSSTPYPLSALP